MKKNGFTLIELTLVLFILALAAHLGTRQLAAIKSSRLRAAADRQLEELADAVCRDRAGDVTGFLSDMGRLPLAVRTSDGASLCLAELYAKPEGMGDFRARPASPGNLAEGAPAAIADTNVLVLCGWGGPYIRLPQGASRLRDPWGNPVENTVGASVSEARLLGEDLTSASAGSPVCAVRHLGSDGMADTNRPPASAEARDATRAIPAAPATPGNRCSPAGPFWRRDTMPPLPTRWWKPQGNTVFPDSFWMWAAAKATIAAGWPGD